MSFLEQLGWLAENHPFLTIGLWMIAMTFAASISSWFRVKIDTKKDK